MFYILVVFALLLCLLDYLINHNEKALLLRKIPGLKYHFLIGNALEVILPPEQLFNLGRRYAKEHKIYRFDSFTLAAVNIYDPDDIEIVISSMKHHAKSGIYNILRPWLRDGLLLSSGPKWQQRRKILTSAFHFNVLRQYYLIFEENNKRLLNNLEKRTGTSVDVVSLLSDYTLETICESAMGTQLSDETLKTGRAYKVAISDIIRVMLNRFIKIYLYPDFIFNLSSFGRIQAKYLSIMHSFTENVIKSRKEDLINNKVETIEFEENAEDIQYSSSKKRAAMLDLLILAEKEGLIDKTGIQEEVDTFMFEGHDTTAAALTFFVLSMANNPEIQEKVVSEQRLIFGETRRAATREDLSKMQYLECCIKETLRLYPPVPFISRALNETVQLSNYTVPKGTFCHIHIYDLHRRPDLYENPEEFDPDRFLPENSEGRHNFAYIPFSAGPRNCIGQKFAMIEMKSVLSAILRNYKLLPVTTPADLVFTADIILRSSKPIYVNFVKRKNII